MPIIGNFVLFHRATADLINLAVFPLYKQRNSQEA